MRCDNLRDATRVSRGADEANGPAIHVATEARADDRPVRLEATGPRRSVPGLRRKLGLVVLAREEPVHR